MEVLANFLLCALGIMFIEAFSLYGWYFLSKTKIQWKNWKMYILLLLLTFCVTAINLFVPKSIKIGCFFILLIITNYFFVLKKLERSVITVIMTQLILMICETIFVSLVLMCIGQSMEEFMSSWYGPLVFNILVSVLSLIILYLPWTRRIYDYLICTFNNVKNSNLISYFISILVVSSIFMILTYMKLPTYIILISNTMLIISYVVIIIKMINSKSNYDKINQKYEMSLTSLQEYEDIMDKYRMANHENKNQLLTIRNMIKSNDKSTVNYIENLVDDRIKDNEEIFGETSKIPEGGLRATIYSKLCRMKELGIKYILDISNNISTTDLIKLGEKDTLDICKIIGVFLDNAIEETIKIPDSEIFVEIFTSENDLSIDITNNYFEKLNIDKIDEARYSTKGDGHGYGLALVKNIIKRNDILENEKIVNGNTFTQRLKIKM